MAKEASDPLHLRRFCQVPLDGRIPHADLSLDRTSVERRDPAVVQEKVKVRTTGRQGMLQGRLQAPLLSVFPAPLPMIEACAVPGC
ncbi:MAG: hypothetical protein ACR2NA_09550 [Solirubrobacterales bacterium]